MLQNQVWVLRELGSGTRAFSDHFIQEEEISVKRSYVFNSSQGVKEAVASGLGIAMLSRWIVRKELASGEICELPIRQHHLERQFSIIRHKESSSSMATHVFIQNYLSLEKISSQVFLITMPDNLIKIVRHYVIYSSLLLCNKI